MPSISTTHHKNYQGLKGKGYSEDLNLETLEVPEVIINGVRILGRPGNWGAKDGSRHSSREVLLIGLDLVKAELKKERNSSFLQATSQRLALETADRLSFWLIGLKKIEGAPGFNLTEFTFDEALWLYRAAKVLRERAIFRARRDMSDRFTQVQKIEELSRAEAEAFAWYDSVMKFVESRSNPY